MKGKNLNRSILRKVIYTWQCIVMITSLSLSCYGLSNVYYIGDSLVHLHLKVLGHRTLPFTPLLQLSYKNNK